MIEISVDGVKDFRTCGLLYDYRHGREMYEAISADNLVYQRFDSTMRKIIAFFFYKKQSGVIPSFNAIINRWEKYWFPKDMTSYELMIDQYSPMSKNPISYNTHAVAILGKFYEEFVNHPADPVYIDEPFIVPINKNVKLSGAFELGMRNPKNKEYTIIKWNTASKRPDNTTTTLDFAALKYAFDHQHLERERDVNFYLYDFNSVDTDPWHKVDVTEKDVMSLCYWADEAISAKLYVPRRDVTTYCKRCPFQSECSEWDGWIDVR